MGLIAAIGNGLRALAEALGIISKRSDLNNAPDVRQGAINVKEQKIQDGITKNVATGNLEEIRKDDAE